MKRESGTVHLLYVSQDGAAPSGISTYGYHVLRAFPEARMLLLNADEPPPLCPPDLRSRVGCVPASESHDPTLVARHVARVAGTLGGKHVVVAPNTGDTPWSAVVAWLAGLDDTARENIRVLGIVHSDTETHTPSRRGTRRSPRRGSASAGLAPANWSDAWRGRDATCMRSPIRCRSPHHPPRRIRTHPCV